MAALLATASALALGTAARAADTLAPGDLNFMKVASQANLAELGAAKLALKKSSNQGVKDVANMIIKGHSTAQSNLMTLAKKLAVTLPMAPDAKHKEMAKMLAAMPEASFDKSYLKGQIADHNTAIKLYKAEADAGKDSQVRSYATLTLGDIYNHTDMIIKVAKTNGIAESAKDKAMGISPTRSGKTGDASMSLPGGKMGGQPQTPKPADPAPGGN